MNKITDPTACMQEQEFRNLTCLYEITRHLASTASLQECLEKVVRTLAEGKNMKNGTVSIVNPSTGMLEIKAAHGIDAEAKQRGHYSLGEDITDKVMATGEPVVVPQPSDEPLLLNRIRGDEHKKCRSFLCVPIMAGQQAIGALSIDRVYPEECSPASEQDLRFLTVVSRLLSESVQRLLRVNEEKEALRLEKTQLRRELNAKNRIDIRRISTPAIDLLVQYHWPGNVRELQNCMERAVLSCDGQTVNSTHLPPTLQSRDSIPSNQPLSLAVAVENFERELIVEALKKSNGNQTKAAKTLATSLRIINYKIHNYGINPRSFKVK